MSRLLSESFPLPAWTSEVINHDNVICVVAAELFSLIATKDDIYHCLTSIYIVIEKILRLQQNDMNESNSNLKQLIFVVVSLVHGDDEAEKTLFFL